jgi:hypothetical protein
VQAHASAPGQQNHPIFMAATKKKLREGIFGKKPPLNGDSTGPGNAQNSVQGAF